jgi:hypothetical protein
MVSSFRSSLLAHRQQLFPGFPRFKFRVIKNLNDHWPRRPGSLGVCPEDQEVVCAANVTAHCLVEELTNRDFLPTRSLSLASLIVLDRLQENAQDAGRPVAFYGLAPAARIRGHALLELRMPRRSAIPDGVGFHRSPAPTPRWDTAGNLADHTVDGQTVSVYQTSPGNLPDASATGHDRKAVTPRIWNASSFYGERGFRPIVLGVLGEDAPAQGDYIFVLNPESTNPVLVRTQNIFDIKHREEWVTTATAPG